MDKNVLISIRGMQMDERNDEDDIEVITQGEYYFQNGKHYVLYDEIIDEYEKPVKNVMKISESGIEITKKGVTNVHMVFEKNKKNTSYYETPMGSIMVGFLAKHISVKNEENDIFVKIEYALDMNCEYVSDCVIDMKIKSRNSEATLDL